MHGLEAPHLNSCLQKEKELGSASDAWRDGDKRFTKIGQPGKPGDLPAGGSPSQVVEVSRPGDRCPLGGVWAAVCDSSLLINLDQNPKYRTKQHNVNLRDTAPPPKNHGYHITLSYQFAMGYKIAGLAKVGYGYLGINGTAGWAYLSYCWIAFECLGL
ncbi:hypothetical protein E3N88_37953 [Mikania micrantha]|uniref:Uncharacterized protein n=1 Tax=Mikania micrantha TaxID=192012 RepID=A0A5N6LSK5_9ASTR|nr:hypothetical protein E3N88_37953 [Mikania micrantha]